MKLIIDVPHSLYANLSTIKNESVAGKRILECVKNGTTIKTGHWIDFGAIEPWFMCSECNERVFGGYKKYCSNCGAKMEEVKEK